VPLANATRLSFRCAPTKPSRCKRTQISSRHGSATLRGLALMHKERRFGERRVEALPWLTQSHTTASFLRNTTPVCRRNNMDHNSCKCATKRNVIFNSEMRQNRLLAGEAHFISVQDIDTIFRCMVRFSGSSNSNMLCKMSREPRELLWQTHFRQK